MVYQRVLWLPGELRAAGLGVITHPGWRSRGLSEDRPFLPRAVVWHHDASPRGDSPGVPDAMVARFETAAAQCWVSRDGTWHVIASGRAPHAGAVLPGMPTNETSVGVEADHTTGEDWPAAQVDSLRRGTAVILRRLGRSADEGLYFHRTIASPPGRKVDPDGLDLARERVEVARLIAPPQAAPIPAVGGGSVATAKEIVDELMARQVLADPAAGTSWRFSAHIQYLTVRARATSVALAEIATALADVSRLTSPAMSAAERDALAQAVAERVNRLRVTITDSTT